MESSIPSLDPRRARDSAGPSSDQDADFRPFFELSGVGNIVADAATYRFMKVNQTFCEITGYSAEELSQLTAFDITYDQDLERDKNGWRECVERGDSHFEIEKRYLRKDGSIVWVTVTSTIVRKEDGAPIHAVGVVRDVSAYHKALEELEAVRSELEQSVEKRTADLIASNQTLATLIDASPLAIIALDSEFRLSMWNRTAEKLFGWKEGEVLGKPLPNFPEDPATKIQMADLFQTRKPFTTETVRQTKEGKLLEVRVWYAPLLEPDGRFMGYVGLLMDISESRFLESALLDASEHEQRRIGQDLHDHLCQHLLGAAFAAKALSCKLHTTEEAIELEQLARNINEAVMQMRDIAKGLHPVELDSAGLMSSLQELAHRVNYSTPCEFFCEGSVLVENAQTALHVYRIAQEAVGDLTRRWGAPKVIISLSKKGNLITLEIRNKGQCKPDTASDQSFAMGEKIMEYRSRAIRGHLTIEAKQENIAITCSFSGK